MIVSKDLGISLIVFSILEKTFPMHREHGWKIVEITFSQYFFKIFSYLFSLYRIINSSKKKMAEANPENEIFSFCKVCNRKTTKSTILAHIAKTQDKEHKEFKNSNWDSQLDK